MKILKKIEIMTLFLIATIYVAQATPVTDGLYMELIADNLSFADGASVTNWVGATSANTLTVYGSVAPTFVAANTNFNNHATVSFVGNSGLRDTSLAGIAPNSENVTVFVVARYNALPRAVDRGAEWLFYSQSVGSDRLRIARTSANWHNGAYQTLVGGDTVGLLTADRVGVNTDLTLFNIRSGGDVVDFNVITTNGVVGSVTGGNGDGLVLSQITLGRSENGNYANTDIAEFLMYDHALTPDEIDQVNDYLIMKYAIPEPDTFSLVVAIGVALVFVRRRLMM